jgi:hypothetical protein
VARRNIEAQEVRADGDALGPAAHIVYTGDFSACGANEPAQPTLLSPGTGRQSTRSSGVTHCSGAQKNSKKSGKSS